MGSPSYFPLLPPDSTAASRAPPAGTPLPASAATFRGARPAGPPRAAVTRWGVSAAVTAAWPAARASRASRAARAPHPRPAAGLEEAKCDSRLSWRPRQGAGAGARPSASEAQPPGQGRKLPGQQTLVWVGVRARAWRAGGASALNGGMVQQWGSRDRESGGAPPGEWEAPPGVRGWCSPPPVALQPLVCSFISASLSRAGLSPSLPWRAVGGEGLTHDDLGLSPAPSQWRPQKRPRLQAGSPQTALSPTAQRPPRQASS